MPRTPDRWFLHEPIAEDFATVWHRATDGSPLGEVAIVRNLREPVFESWFRHEIALRKKLLAVIGLARVLDDGVVDGGPWLAQEWLEGATLADVLQRCRTGRVPIPMELSVFVMAQVARHLDSLHRALDEKGPLEAVHRNVCPSGIHLGYDGLVRLPTLLCSRSRLGAERSALGTIVGNFAYLSPEGAHGDRVDHRGDQFAAGLVLYELVTGVRPYRGATDEEVHRAARAARVARPREHQKWIPEELEEAILQALQKDPDARFDDCGQLAEELEEIAALFETRATAETLVGFLRRLDGAIAS